MEELVKRLIETRECLDGSDRNQHRAISLIDEVAEGFRKISEAIQAHSEISDALAQLSMIANDSPAHKQVSKQLEPLRKSIEKFSGKWRL